MRFIDDLTEIKKGKYWWNYGEIGQKLVEESDNIKKLLKKKYKIMDGHSPPPKNKFKNLSNFFHLDIVVYNKNEVKAICEVKTTKNQSKKEFGINGACGLFMVQARKKKIPLYFAVVRLNGLMPTEIITKKGYNKVLKDFLKDNSKYKIEFYPETKFVIENGFFKIK